MLQPECQVGLAGLTTMEVGGPARYLARGTTGEEMRAWLSWAEERRLALQVLGGGSNVLFADEGFDGLVLRIESRGVEDVDQGDCHLVTAAAGEDWDGFVERCVESELCGVECLSGIPGLVGATPMQNVGAYGQEVSQTIVEVAALDRRTLEERRFTAGECDFGYRTSRFKGEDRDRFVITAVTYRLERAASPSIRYPELRRYLDDRVDLERLAPGRPALRAIREAVLALRRRKSMVIEAGDPNRRSVGSFFLNPILDESQLEALRQRVRTLVPEAEPIPTFAERGGHKVPAAWLVEQAGFRKGERRGGAGISTRHALALVNHGGGSREVLALADEIAGVVQQRLGVRLEREPVVVAGG